MFSTEKLDSFPPNSNPFHHDAISVGQSLAEIGLPNVFIMDSATFGPGFYIVNADTGERVRVRGIEGR